MNDSSKSRTIGYQSKMVELSLSAQCTQDLTGISEIIEDLLSYSKILPAELRIKLDTLHADIAVILEDREGTPEERDGNEIKWPAQETT
jgi:hypothetical protein